MSTPTTPDAQPPRPSRLAPTLPGPDAETDELSPLAVADLLPPSPDALPVGAFPAPAYPPDPRRASGTNGLAVAALCLGLAFFLPFASVVAIVLGFVALSQLRAGTQRGRGFAVGGVVLGLLGVAAWAVFVVVLALSGPDRDPTTGAVAPSSQAFVDELADGDCFDDDPDDLESAYVTAVACAGAHDGQVVSTVDLPGEDWPGEDRVIKLAEKACGDEVGAVVSDSQIDHLDIAYLYPDTEFAWRTNQQAVCVVHGLTGQVTGSALR